MRKLNQQHRYSLKLCRTLALGFTILAMAGVARADTVVNTYDALNRLTRVQSDNGTVIEYAYDSAGNRTTRTVTPAVATQPPSLSALISAKTGTQNARVWTITLSNSGAGTALNARITGLALTQTYGAACTPVITSPLPLIISDITPQSSASGQATINFTGCVALARFTTTISYSSNNGTVTGSKTLYNQFR